MVEETTYLCFPIARIFSNATPFYALHWQTKRYSRVGIGDKVIFRIRSGKRHFVYRACESHCNERSLIVQSLCPCIAATEGPQGGALRIGVKNTAPVHVSSYTCHKRVCVSKKKWIGAQRSQESNLMRTELLRTVPINVSLSFFLNLCDKPITLLEAHLTNKKLDPRY